MLGRLRTTIIVLPPFSDGQRMCVRSMLARQDIPRILTIVSEKPCLAWDF